MDSLSLVIEELASKYQIPAERIMQFNFFAFPISVNGSVIQSNQLLGRDTFDRFSGPVYKALRYAVRNNLVFAHKFECYGDSCYEDFICVFTVLSDDGDEAEKAPCMLHIVLHDPLLGENESLVEIASESNVTVLKLEEAKELLQNKLREAWKLDLTIEWDVR